MKNKGEIGSGQEVSHNQLRDAPWKVHRVNWFIPERGDSRACDMLAKHPKNDGWELKNEENSFCFN